MLPTKVGLDAVTALLCVYLFMTISIFKSGMAGAYMAVKLLLHTSLFLYRTENGTKLRPQWVFMRASEAGVWLETQRRVPSVTLQRQSRRLLDGSRDSHVTYAPKLF